MKNQASQTLATTNAGIVASIEQALDSLSEATAAAAVLAERLAHVMPQGAPEAIHELLSAGSHHEAGHEHESALECLVGSLSRRVDALAAAITATHEAVRL